MATKLKREPIGAELIDEAVREDDFGFELSCLRLLESEKVAVRHAGTYSDPVLKLNRQFDFRVTIPVSNRSISLAIECKNLKPSFPLVISRLPRRETEAFHEVLEPPPHASAGRFAFPVTDFCRGYRIDAPRSIYAVGEPVGKATTQIGVKEGSAKELFSGDAEVYDRWTQALASGYGLVEEAAHSLRYGVDNVWRFLILPILVVPDGTIWAVDYDAEGRRVGVTSQQNHAEFYLDQSPWKSAQRFSYTFSHLHFVTQSGLVSFVRRLRDDKEYQAKLFGPEQSADDAD